MKEPHEYHPLTDARWVDSVAAEAVTELMLYATTSKCNGKITEEELQVLEKQQNFLGRAMRGFVVEFLRQTAERRTDFNYDSSITDPSIIPSAAIPGVFHATACVDGLHKRGLTVEKSCYVMGLCIRHAIDTFTERFNEHEELQDYREPMASVLHRSQQIEDHIKKLAQSEQKLDRTHSS